MNPNETGQQNQQNWRSSPLGEYLKRPQPARSDGRVTSKVYVFLVERIVWEPRFVRFALQSSWEIGGATNTLATLSPKPVESKTRTYLGRVGSGRTAGRRGGVGQDWMPTEISPRRQGSVLPAKASTTSRLNVSPEARKSEILCKQHAGQISG